MGIVFNIQKFCTNDGPGIRTTVFFKGCPLRCVWCHNPESHLKQTEIAYSEDKCAECRRCADICEKGAHSFENGKHLFDREKCVACGKCVNPLCPATESYGYDISAEDLIAEALKDKRFYERSGGGITLSGGEPLAQPDFCLEVLKLAKKAKLHVCMETCAYANAELIEETAKYVDMYLFDWKHTDNEKHKEYTGVGNTLILNNLRLLSSLGKSIVLRCPIVPGYNDTKEHFAGIAMLANELPSIQKIELEPYHSFGVDKYKALSRDCGEQCRIKTPEKDEMNKAQEYIRSLTDREVTVQ